MMKCNRIFFTIKKIIVILILLNLSLFSQSLNIALASNVSYAINDLKKEFNKIHPNINVNIILGSSGALSAQIQNAAPYDIFMSANMIYPEHLYSNNFSNKAEIYAKGSLVIFSNKERDFKNGLNIISNKNIKRVAIANPKTAPYGKASLEALKNSKLYEKNKHKLIFGHSIAHTLSYAFSAAQIAIVAKSSLFSQKMRKFKKDLNWIDVNTSFYTPIEQGIVIIKKSKNKEEAKKFYDFILSKKAKKILEEYGYIIP